MAASPFGLSRRPAEASSIWPGEDGPPPGLRAPDHATPASRSAPSFLTELTRFEAGEGGDQLPFLEQHQQAAEGCKPVDDAYSLPLTVWVDAVTDPVELASIGATCRAPSDEAASFVDGDLLIFADWLNALGQLADVARTRLAHSSSRRPGGKLGVQDPDPTLGGCGVRGCRRYGMCLEKSFPGRRGSSRLRHRAFRAGPGGGGSPRVAARWAAPSQSRQGT